MARPGRARRVLLAALLLLGPLTPLAAAAVTNGDWSTGDETGWTRWSAPWGDAEWDVTSSGLSPPEGALALGAGKQGSFGWYQRVAAPVGSIETVRADWSGSIGTRGWAEVMFFSVTPGTSHADIVSRIDEGGVADIAFKRDSWGMNPPTAWSWQAADLSPHPQGNGGQIQSIGELIVALKLGSIEASESAWASFDNIAVGREPTTLAWTGSTNNTWDINLTPNWSQGGTPCRYTEGDDVIFDHTGAGSPLVNLVATVAPGSVVVDADAVDFVLSGLGCIAGPCGLAKRGSSILTIATANAYTGETQILAGTVIVASDSALGAGPVNLGDTTGFSDASLLVAGAFTVDCPVAVQDDGSAWSNRTLGGANTAGTAVFSGDIMLDTDLTLTAAPGGTVRLASTLVNAAGNIVTKVGEGTVIFDGLQAHGPGALLEVLEGTTILNTDAGANLSISVDAELYFGCNQHLDTLTIGETGKVVFAGARTVVLEHLVMEGVDLGPTTLTPEPTTLGLLALGGLGALLRRRRK